MVSQFFHVPLFKTLSVANVFDRRIDGKGQGVVNTLLMPPAILTSKTLTKAIEKIFLRNFQKPLDKTGKV